MNKAIQIKNIVSIQFCQKLIGLMILACEILRKFDINILQICSPNCNHYKLLMPNFLRGIHVGYQNSLRSVKGERIHLYWLCA